MPNTPAIAFLPYRTKLGRSLSVLPLSELAWPLGCPPHLLGGVVGDLTANDHLLMFPETAVHYLPWRGTKARFSLVMGEPSYIHAKHLALLRLTWRRFHKVLTFNKDLIARIPNGVFFPYGTTWVPNWRSLSITKSDMCSLIASAKRDSAGHLLRHAIVDWSKATDQNVTVMGRGYTPFDDKSDGLAPFRYSVVIENGREENYFSEKLLDAVFCQTVPIYWGCPNISDFVDTSAMIVCNSETDVKRAISSMSIADYEERLPALLSLAEQLAPFSDLQSRAARVILTGLTS
jgi:hypothetical protein